MARSRHHIQPKSREGTNAKDNIAFISGKSHQNYHILFGNRTPIEILDFLVSYFWKGNKQFLYEYLERR